MPLPPLTSALPATATAANAADPAGDAPSGEGFAHALDAAAHRPSQEAASAKPAPARPDLGTTPRESRVDPDLCSAGLQTDPLAATSGRDEPADAAAPQADADTPLPIDVAALLAALPPARAETAARSPAADTGGARVDATTATRVAAPRVDVDTRPADAKARTPGADDRAPGAEARAGAESRATTGGAPTAPADLEPAPDPAAAPLARHDHGEAAAPTPRRPETASIDAAAAGTDAARPAAAPPAPPPGFAAAPPTPGAASAHGGEVQATVGSPTFAPALGAHVVTLVRNGVEQAEVRLNPAELGPVAVHIRVEGSQAQVDFSAANALTRQALQDAVPALAGALRESGLTLTGGGVFEQPRDPRQTGEQARATPADPRPGSSVDAAGAATARGATRVRGMVDVFA